MNDKLIAALTSIAIIFFFISIPLNIFSGFSLGVGSTIEIVVALYILLMSGLFIFIFRKFS
ncbi:hypothetical protein GWK48_06580 [Metallosphaera tengchongensis]|uniref:Uncharacterized protein n=1 Tax=Metallosphaera tengchongensis TaxID=1532350 RepID=A0A6N0NW42_9CREN|nr:hypothetical protein [Metallosphaera tengchongensis]QKR00083.1 hypothetical protein GWK48_06580 [Metallosphaera tengchongensis]